MIFYGISHHAKKSNFHGILRKCLRCNSDKILWNFWKTDTKIGFVQVGFLETQEDFKKILPPAFQMPHFSTIFTFEPAVC